MFIYLPFNTITVSLRFQNLASFSTQLACSKVFFIYFFRFSSKRRKKNVEKYLRIEGRSFQVCFFSSSSTERRKTRFNLIWILWKYAMSFFYFRNWELYWRAGLYEVRYVCDCGWKNRHLCLLRLLGFTSPKTSLNLPFLQSYLIKMVNLTRMWIFFAHPKTLFYYMGFFSSLHHLAENKNPFDHILCDVF